jgi:hypothetical protein
MGQMHLSDLTDDKAASVTQLKRRAQLDITHPQNTDLPMNQVTRTFIPLHLVIRVEVRKGEQLISTVTPSENLRSVPKTRTAASGSRISPWPRTAEQGRQGLGYVAHVGSAEPRPVAPRSQRAGVFSIMAGASARLAGPHAVTSIDVA